MSKQTFFFGSTPTQYFLHTSNGTDTHLPADRKDGEDLTDEQKQQCVEHWPKSGYAVQKARARADRFVGEYVRRESTMYANVCVEYKSESFNV